MFKILNFYKNSFDIINLIKCHVPRYPMRKKTLFHVENAENLFQLHSPIYTSFRDCNAYADELDFSLHLSRLRLKLGIC